MRRLSNLVVLPRREHIKELRLVELDGGCRQHPLDRLVRGDRLAELLPALAVRDRHLQQVLARSDRTRGERDPADVEGAEGGAEARSDLTAQDVRLGDLAVLEDELAGVAAAKAHLVVDLPDA